MKGFHITQIVKSILSVKYQPVVCIAAVFFYISPGERRSAQNNRYVYMALIENFQILFHYYCRFDQQSAHPDKIGIVLDSCIDDIVDRLFDA